MTSLSPAVAHSTDLLDVMPEASPPCASGTSGRGPDLCCGELPSGAGRARGAGPTASRVRAWVPRRRDVATYGASVRRAGRSAIEATVTVGLMPEARTASGRY